MNVYTYFMPVRGLRPPEEELRLIDVWKRSWAKQGWKPVVLNEAVAQKHPRFAEFKKKFWDLPTEYGHDYEGACFMRWVATAAMGGGMMTDYDVINYSFAPQAPLPDRMQIFANNPPGGIFLGMVLATKELYERMCQRFLSWELTQADWNPNARPEPMYHCSDLSLLHNYPIPDWIVRTPGCGLYPHGDWNRAHVVHYGYEMHHAGFWPKFAYIEKIRAF
jgi:hypothetical protein